jgi:DNA-binding HxlR family transcriptional regulator
VHHQRVHEPQNRVLESLRNRCDNVEPKTTPKPDRAFVRADHAVELHGAEASRSRVPQRVLAHRSRNILADRLRTLVEQGILTRSQDPSHKQKTIYSLTEQGIELLPVLAQMAVWGRKYLPVSEELGIRAQLLEEGGPPLWDEFMSELRETHLGAPSRRRSKSGGPSVAARLQAAYEAVVAKRRKSTSRPSGG